MDEFDNAVSLAKNNKPKDALDICLRLLKNDSENDLLNYFTGHLQTLLNDFVNAEKHLLKALSIQPNNINYMNSLGCLRMDQGRLEDAIRIYDLILEHDNFAPARHNLGLTFIQFAKEHQICGWFLPEEAAALYLYAKRFDKDNPIVVELGSCFGLSSMIFAFALKGKPDAKIYCIDIWDENGLSVDGKTAEIVQNLKRDGGSFFNAFKGLMERIGVLEQLTPIQGYTADIAKDWREAIDILFIDASHTYEGTKDDFNNWQESIASGGLLLMHDVEIPSTQAQKNAGPGQVVEELILGNPDYQNPELIKTLYKVEKNKDNRSS